MIKSESQLFLIEEYKNIANTHDQLRNNIFMLFNYFLIASALPFTVLTLVQKISVPQINVLIGLFFLLISCGDILLACSMIEAKLRQYSYARAVNLIRKNFSDSDKELGRYLGLPSDQSKPNFTDLGSTKYLIMFMFIVASVYLWAGLFFWFGSPIKINLISSLVLFLVLSLIQKKIIENYIKKHEKQ